MYDAIYLNVILELVGKLQYRIVRNMSQFKIIINLIVYYSPHLFDR